MKHLKLLSLLLMATFGVLAFTACGDDDSGDKGNGNGNITPEQLIGTWYGVDENSSKKINIFVMNFATIGTGHYAEYKAKAEENWVPREPQSADVTWTLTNGTLNANVKGTTRKGDILSINGNKITVRRYLDEGQTDEVVMTRVSSADEFMQIFYQMIATKTGGGQGGDINPSDLVGTWSSIAFTPEGGERIEINRTQESLWKYYKRYRITADGKIEEWSINYNGDEEIRGREEKTLIGKYRIEGNTFSIYDFYEGYKNVSAYEKNGGGTMQAGPMQATISLSNSIFYVTVAGKGTYELQKEEVGEPTEASILGTWGTKEIIGSASDPDTKQVIENWDNYPSINDADTDKESLKYMEFTFGENSAFKLQQFDDQKRTFTEIMEGTWKQEGNTLSVDFGNGNGRSVELVSLTADQLVIHMNYIDYEFRVKETGKKTTVIYDETIYFSRVK